jgi:predicted nuclease of predicted toxin-antitoxin system
MRFIVDESTGSAVASSLRAAGHEVVFIGEDMPQATDAAIIERAAREELILVTNDKDFGELVFRTGRKHHGILLLRLQDERAANRVAVLNSILERFSERLAGNFVVATEKGVRIRPRE